MPIYADLKIELERWVDKRTLILGDVNTGKTHYTEQVLRVFAAAGFGPRIAVLDLAPQTTGQIGGKMTSANKLPVLYLTGPITAPRLTAATHKEAERLAAENAHLIGKLFERFAGSGRRILFINDVTLYLQAGSFRKLELLLQGISTLVVNAYYGTSFPPSPLTRRERETTERLQALFDSVIYL